VVPWVILRSVSSCLGKNPTGILGSCEAGDVVNLMLPTCLWWTLRWYCMLSLKHPVLCCSSLDSETPKDCDRQSRCGLPDCRLWSCVEEIKTFRNSWWGILHSPSTYIDAYSSQFVVCCVVSCGGCSFGPFSFYQFLTYFCSSSILSEFLSQISANF